jgi:hypothetical protein
MSNFLHRFIKDTKNFSKSKKPLNTSGEVFFSLLFLPVDKNHYRSPAIEFTFFFSNMLREDNY